MMSQVRLQSVIAFYLVYINNLIIIKLKHKENKYYLFCSILLITIIYNLYKSMTS